MAGEGFAAKLYARVWDVLVRWLRVPDEPPTLPVHPGDTREQFRPAPGFLRYLKIWFWLGLLPIDILILVGWIALTVAVPLAGVLLFPVAVVLAVAPDIVVYVALHVRFDTTWYVMTERSVRIRRGVWIIREITLTFENVQNVLIQQGPLQRHYGIANIVIETAGGGGGGPEVHNTHQGVIEGIADPQRLRELILTRLKRSKSAGLGDDDRAEPSRFHRSPAHLTTLREIRDAARALPSPPR